LHAKDWGATGLKNSRLDAYRTLFAFDLDSRRVDPRCIIVLLVWRPCYSPFLLAYCLLEGTRSAMRAAYGESGLIFASPMFGAAVRDSNTGDAKRTPCHIPVSTKWWTSCFNSERTIAAPTESF
jgi:hypothetical protein